MKVFKFGGASLATAEGYKNVASVIDSFAGKKLVVVSAMGKTTNALEAMVKAMHEGDVAGALAHAEAVSKLHRDTAMMLDPSGSIVETLGALEDKLRTEASRAGIPDFDELYDRVVPFGELLSSLILAEYMKRSGTRTVLLDARGIVRTSSEFRFATVDVERTADLARQAVAQDADVCILQGFIGQDEEGRSTTLGREGSDYTAALMAYSLNASEMTIWKDVDGIFSADPKKFSQAELLPHLNYRLAAEMTFYGAQVIHPRTLQPLAGKGIELKVKSFLKPAAEGSVISGTTTEVKAPIIIQKEDLTLLTCTSTGLVYINDGAIGQILGEASRMQARVFLMQHSALSFSIAIGSDINKAENLRKRLAGSFHVTTNADLTLLTLKNPSEGLEAELLAGHEVLLSQFSRRTHQFLIRKAGKSERGRDA